ncbi:hypothetical protein ABZS68_35410 [Streptomyces sp. NPDC005571]
MPSMSMSRLSRLGTSRPISKITTSVSATDSAAEYVPPSTGRPGST